MQVKKSFFIQELLIFVAVWARFLRLPAIIGLLLCYVKISTWVCRRRKTIYCFSKAINNDQIPGCQSHSNRIHLFVLCVLVMADQGNLWCLPIVLAYFTTNLVAKDKISFLWLSIIPWHLYYHIKKETQVISYWTLRWFHFLAIVIWTAVHIRVQITP